MDNKHTNSKSKNTILLWTIVTLVLVSGILICFFRDINEVTNELIDKSIMAQETEKEDHISSDLNATLDVLDGIAAGVMGNSTQDARYVYQTCKEYIESGQFEYINFIDKNGQLYQSNGSVVDVSESYGFQDALRGKSSISSPQLETHTNLMLVYYIVPLRSEEGIQGALVGARLVSHVEKELFEKCTAECADVIVDGNHIVTFSSLKGKDQSYNHVVWDMMENCGIRFNATDMQQMQSDMAQGKSGKFQVKGSEYYLVYTPVTARENWSLVSLVTSEQYSTYRKNVYAISTGSIFMAVIVIALFCAYVVRRDKRKSEELRQVELVDSLTGLGNKAAFYETLRHVMKHHEKKEYVIFLFDINNFKLINHNYSYQQGDKVLCCVANTLVNMVPQRDMVARQSADCFSMLVEKQKFDGNAILDRITEEIREKFGASIAGSIHFLAGYYEVSDRTEDIRNMMDKATMAWKHAKEKENVCKAYDETILLEQLKVKQIEDSQVNALTTNEFKVYLQPKVDLRKNTICGAEALVRWISEELGFMAPDEFIPIVEGNGFIKEIDFFVLEQVCAGIRERMDRGERIITISVNQSRITILDEHYIERVKNIIEKYQIPVKYLDFEVTESLFIGDFNTILQVLAKIHLMGISISMDDFGSGYSSLNLLKKISIDNLKIDKEFLSESIKSKQSRIIIQSLIEMARDLGIHVVCEGVELIEQVDFLRAIQCDEAQGYYYDRPIPSTEFYEKLSRGSYDDLSFETKERNE